METAERQLRLYLANFIDSDVKEWKMSSPKTILIVEDETIIAMAVKRSLKKLGYGVSDIVQSGEQAIQRTRDNHPDLVLMDIVLEGELDGVETAERIRSAFHIPVVYLTAHTDQETLKRAKITEPFGYIVKPFKERDLRVTIEMAFWKHEMEESRRKLALELKEALAKVKMLSGLLPICATCKKIRNDEGYWEQIEVFIRDHSEAEFSHGMCPDCTEALYSSINRRKSNQ
jgi:two-component system, response regulator PdtaR